MYIVVLLLIVTVFFWIVGSLLCVEGREGSLGAHVAGGFLWPFFLEILGKFRLVTPKFGCSRAMLRGYDVILVVI